MQKFSLTLFTILLAVGAFASTAPRQPLVIAFGPDSINVSSVAPGGRVYIYSLAREADNFIVDVKRREQILSDDDRDGKVTWSMGQAVPVRSMWAAIDLDTGAYAAGAPGDYPVTRVPLDSKHLKKDMAGEVSHVAFDATVVDVVVVRPGAGIWEGLVGLRGSGDAGTEAAEIVAPVELLEPRAGTTTPAPKRLKKGDVVLLLNSFRATYGIAAVGEAE